MNKLCKTNFYTEIAIKHHKCTVHCIYLQLSCRKLILNPLSEEPTKRISIPGMKDHTWLKGSQFPAPLELSSLQPELTEDVPEDQDDREAQRILDDLGGSNFIWFNIR